jgi:hypothetical protein
MKRKLKNILFVFGVANVYMLLLLTKDIQEDAFITFRVAFNLADHGVFSFNLDEHYNSVTSFLYPLGIALLRFIFGAFTIPALQVMNALAVLGACWVLAKILRDLFYVAEAFQWSMWCLLSLLPHTLVLAVRSMEMPYVVLLFVVALRGLQIQSLARKAVVDEIRKHSYLSSGVCIAGLLPFVRPDATAFSLILAGVAFLIRPICAVRYLIATFLGCIVYLVANDLLWGSVLPNTIAAKTISYSGLTFSGFFSSWTAVMNEVAFPVDVKYFYFFKPACGMIAAVLVVVFLSILWLKRRDQFPVLAGMAVVIFGLPTAYALGGVIFPWYLWPSQYLCTGVLLGCVIYVITRVEHRVIRQTCWLGLFVAGFLMMPLQLARSYNWGVMEGVYRAKIGTYIAGVSNSKDTLFLEPAGYIPFYAKLKTIDEIGLTSPIAVKYKKENKNNWWMNCVKQERPTFLVQREGFTEYRTHHGYTLSTDEIRWFNENYQLIKRFCYTPKEYTNNAFLVRLLRLSSTHDYYVFKLRKTNE